MLKSDSFLFKLLLFSFFLSLVVGFFLTPQQESEDGVEGLEGTPWEILEILNTNERGLREEFYEKLIERTGPERAQEYLYKSGLPFDGETHLLNHTVGDWLYKKYGNQGLIYCRDYFLSSCYHGFVLNSVAIGGLAALNSVMEICWSKGYHVAIQCSHAIGHGFLTWVGYAHLDRALATCDEFGKLAENFPVYNCYDGAFMENVWAVHTDGKPSKDRWVRERDDVYPCSDKRIGYKYINACWSNQPALLYIRWGDLARVGRVCERVRDKVHQITCFDGLARQIHSLTDASVEETFRLCNFMPTEKWWSACIASNAKSTFGIGDRELSFKICSGLDVEHQESCFKELVGIISAYAQSFEEKEELCRKIPITNIRLECS